MSWQECQSNPGGCQQSGNTNWFGYPAHFDLQDFHGQISNFSWDNVEVTFEPVSFDRWDGPSWDCFCSADQGEGSTSSTTTAAPGDTVPTGTPRCESWCALQTQPWSAVCTWPDCTGCSQCGSPEPCAQGGAVWMSHADGHSCGSRIEWLQSNVFAGDLVMSQQRVATEYPDICCACAPEPCAQVGAVWMAKAAGHSCGSRIEWLQSNALDGDLETWKQRVAEEYPDICGACAPETATSPPSTCSAMGVDCRTTRCCSDPSLTCYEKNQWWGSCKATCTPGAIDMSHLEQWRTPWSCNVLTPSDGGRRLRGLTV